MADAALMAVGDDVDKLAPHLEGLLDGHQMSLSELVTARAMGDIDDEEFESEIEREKQLLEVELLTLQIIAKASVQKAINAAMDVLKDSIRLAI
jgi:hypothetical protein